MTEESDLIGGLDRPPYPEDDEPRSWKPLVEMLLFSVGALIFFGTITLILAALGVDLREANYNY